MDLSPQPFRPLSVHGTFLFGGVEHAQTGPPLPLRREPEDAADLKSSRIFLRLGAKEVRFVAFSRLLGFGMQSY